MKMLVTWTRMGAVQVVRNGQILVEMTLFVDGFDVRYERKHRVKDDPELFDQSNWQAFSKMEEEASFAGEDQEFGLEHVNLGDPFRYSGGDAGRQGGWIH